MKKILFISAYTAPFVEKDILILRKEYSLQLVWGRRLKKTIWNYLLIFLITGWQVMRSDIIYCWFADFRARAGVFWAKLFNKRSVVVIGGYEVKGLLYDNIDLRNRSSHFDYLLQNADLIINVSDVYQTGLCEIFPEYADKMIKIYNGIDIDDQEDSEFKKENLILTVCQGDSLERYKEKGLDLFLYVAEKLPEYQFVIIGPEGRLYEIIINNCQSENIQIISAMPEDQLKEWYRKARVYCQFSQNESFGLALVESMLYKCIPVVSPIASLIERIDDTGWVMKKWNIQEAVDCIVEAMNSGSEAGDKASKHVKEHYDIRIRERELLKKLRELINGKE